MLIISSTKDAVVEIGLHAFQQTQLCIVIQKTCYTCVVDWWVYSNRKNLQVFYVNIWPAVVKYFLNISGMQRGGLSVKSVDVYDILALSFKRLNRDNIEHQKALV